MAGLSLCVVAVLVVVLLRDGRHEVAPAQVDLPRASPAQAAATLAAFVDGVEARDARSLAALAPSDDQAASEVLTGIAETAAALDLRGVSARYVDQVGSVAADGTWSGGVEVTWQVGTLDRSSSSADVAITFTPDGDGLAIAGFGGASGTGRVPLWLRGELAVADAPGVLVMVDGTEAAAKAVVRRVERGIDVVRRVLPRRVRPVVVEVPASAADLDATLGAEPGTYAGIAAVTTTAGDTTDDEAPVHVFLNPDVTAGLRRAGAQVVMSHELVHVFTDAVRSPVEPWLLEGFADYVALRDVGLPDRITLGQAIKAVRRDGVPDALPTAVDFDTRARDLQARYEEAWLACRIIADRVGERELVSLYDVVASGAPMRISLARAGLSLRELVPLWRERLQRLAG